MVTALLSVHVSAEQSFTQLGGTVPGISRSQTRLRDGRTDFKVDGNEGSNENSGFQLEIRGSPVVFDK